MTASEKRKPVRSFLSGILKYMDMPYEITSHYIDLDIDDIDIYV